MMSSDMSKEEFMLRSILAKGGSFSGLRFELGSPMNQAKIIILCSQNSTWPYGAIVP
jgi:hypothetical protein